MHANYPQDLGLLPLRKTQAPLEIGESIVGVSQVQAGARLSVRPSRLHWITDGCMSSFKWWRSYVRFVFRFKTETMHCRGRVDPDILDKVVTNLLSNAFKYLGDQDEALNRRHDREGWPEGKNLSNR